MRKITSFLLGAFFLGNSFAGGLPVKRQFQYELVMSKDDMVCRPILGIFNQNIKADLIDLRLIDDPSRYRNRPQPMPNQIAVRWKTLVNKGGNEIAIITADVDGDGEPELVERHIDRVRRDGLFVSLWFMPKSYQPFTVGYSQESYQKLRHEALMVVEEKGFVFAVEPYNATTLNAFDLIKYGGKFYLTARSHVLDDDLYFERGAQQWRVVSAIKGNSHNSLATDAPAAILATEDVCHFLMKAN